MKEARKPLHMKYATNYEWVFLKSDVHYLNLQDWDCI